MPVICKINALPCVSAHGSNNMATHSHRQLAKRHEPASTLSTAKQTRQKPHAAVATDSLLASRLI
jgi:hypothetical protein